MWIRGRVYNTHNGRVEQIDTNRMCSNDSEPSKREGYLVRVISRQNISDHRLGRSFTWLGCFKGLNGAKLIRIRRDSGSQKLSRFPNIIYGGYWIMFLWRIFVYMICWWCTFWSFAISEWETWEVSRVCELNAIFKTDERIDSVL